MRKPFTYRYKFVLTRWERLKNVAWRFWDVRRSLICLERIPPPPPSNREAHHKYLDSYVMYGVRQTRSSTRGVGRTRSENEKNKKEQRPQSVRDSLGRDKDTQREREREREKKSEFLFVIVESPVPRHVVIPVVRYTRYNMLMPIYYYYNKYTTVVYRATCVSFNITLLYTIIIL